MPHISPKTTPIYQTSVFTFEDLNALERYFEQPGQSYMYTRYSNPNSDELAEQVNALEEGTGAVVTSSGMSAILAAMLASVFTHNVCCRLPLRCFWPLHYIPFRYL